MLTSGAVLLPEPGEASEHGLPGYRGVARSQRRSSHTLPDYQGRHLQKLLRDVCQTGPDQQMAKQNKRHYSPQMAHDVQSEPGHRNFR